MGNRGTIGSGDVQWMTTGAESSIRRCQRATSRAGCMDSSCGETFLHR
jgi:hypothetical protein